MPGISRAARKPDATLHRLVDRGQEINAKLGALFPVPPGRLV
jgi:hypothetical protein